MATDLSQRTDRALDRALHLARSWKAALLVVHAIEETADAALRREVPSWRRPSDHGDAVRERIHRDLGAQSEGIRIDVDVGMGDPGKVILESAERSDADLIVSGVARDATFRHILLGSTVDHLARRLPVPLLIVRDRPAATYDRLVVATDFSDSSRIALEMAMRFFPKARLSLFHAYDIPFAGYLGREEIARNFQTLGIEASDRFLLEAGIPSSQVGRVERMIEHGRPETLLGDFGRHSTRHLTVVGSHGGGFVYEALIGSTARRIIHAVPGDVLLVPGAAGKAEPS